ncbi:MAG: oligosaccharide flippase family protein [Acidobacteria bacterium]|nr:oligosaccharide flippase family protein [Acidobacteriota bacterium]
MNEKRSKWLELLLGMTPAETMRSRAARDVVGSLFLHVTGRMLQIGLAILLARILPLKGLGLYALVMSWMMVMMVPSLLGTRQFVQREIAVAKSREQWNKTKSLLHWSTLTVFIFSFLIFIIASCWVFIVMPSDNPDRFAYLFGFMLIPLTALLQLWLAQLRGWGSILAGQIPEVIIRRLLFGFLLLAVSIIFFSTNMNASNTLLIQCTATVIALGITALLKLRYIRIPGSALSKPETWKWLRLSSRFALLSGLAILNSQIGILMVGAMLGKADTGLFSIAAKGADLLVVGFAAASMALAPRMAAFYHEHQYGKLQQMITRTYRVVVLVTFPVFLLFIVTGDVFLSIFGPAFVTAWPALIILSFGQFFGVLFGPMGTMLNMAGHERVTALGAAASVIVTIVFNFILIPLIGINGAAVGAVLGMITWNLLLTALCYRRLGIWTPVLGMSLVKKRFSDS